MRDRLRWIAETGFNGAARDWIRPGIHLDVYKDRCIYFRIDAETVTILRVVHGAQDVAREEIEGL